MVISFSYLKVNLQATTISLPKLPYLSNFHNEKAILMCEIIGIKNVFIWTFYQWNHRLSCLCLLSSHFSVLFFIVFLLPCCLVVVVVVVVAFLLFFFFLSLSFSRTYHSSHSPKQTKTPHFHLKTFHSRNQHFFLTNLSFQEATGSSDKQSVESPPQTSQPNRQQR